ncbi:MAG: histidine kinase [Lachnospiraceae bacterium]|nr:histidine kinase [Lachnospiraceae bacterium]
MKKITRIYHNLPIFYKSLLWMLAVAMIPLSFVVILSLTKILAIETSHSQSEIVDNLRWIENEVRQEVDELRLQGIKVTLNEMVRAELSKEEKTHANLYEVKKSLFDIALSGRCHSAYIVDNRGLQVSNYHAAELDEEIGKRAGEFWIQLENSGKTYMWGTPMKFDGNYLLPYVRFIWGNGEERMTGLFIANLPESRLSYLSGKTMNKGSLDVENVLILNGNTIISSWDKKLIGQSFQDLLGDLSLYTGHSFDVEYDSQDCLLLQYENPEASDWRYVAILSYREIHKASRSMIRLFILVSIFCVLFLFMASYLVSRSISKPLEYLSGAMLDMGTHELNVELKCPDYRDEVGQMWSCLIAMQERLKKSISQSQRAMEQNQRLRIETLRMQINPHFLYNTFGSIVYLIGEGKKREATEMLSALSELLHISISRSMDYILVEQELGLIRRYMDIQKIRYKNTFRYLIDVDLQVQKLSMVKIVLQPVVENALEHGLKMRPDAGGETLLVIRGFRVEELLIFEVMDNCGTLTDQRLGEVNDWLCDRQSCIKAETGIGLKNVNDRIRLEYPQDERLGVCLEKRGEKTITRITMRVMEGTSGEKDT